jgi:hypothetical protein
VPHSSAQPLDPSPEAVDLTSKQGDALSKGFDGQPDDLSNVLSTVAALDARLLAVEHELVEIRKARRKFVSDLGLQLADVFHRVSESTGRTPSS